ncbi:MAG: class I SAM-dependent methyltransferase [Methylocystis sp.]|uniref:methyltransferase domain-containing protein n=1 Tax=Methylocystis sp. TaxID=1911079 RepID=UPI0039437A36
MQMPACRFCGAPLNHDFVDLGSTPLANSYVTEEEIARGLDRSFPLHARVCDACFLVQVDAPVSSEAIFSDYAYFSSYSDSWVAHARRYADAMIERFGLGPRSLVIEVASNDGYLLQHFIARGVPVLGVEPAANVAEAARARGVPTEVAFFGKETARKLAARGVAADLTAANNVLAHVPDIGDFVAGFAEILKPDGVATFEFPHVLNLIRELQFDTIYHEHFSYLSLVAVERVLAANGLVAFDVEELPTHGGSLRLYVCRKGASHAPTPRLEAARSAERAARLDAIEGYAGFAEKVEAVKASFLNFLARAKAEGKTVAAYGAAAKGNTFLNVCGVNANDIVCVYDRSAAKQGKLLPGSHIPIRAPETIGETRPDYLVILPWNLREEIMGQMADIRSWGGKFVTAVPETRVLDA